MLLNIIIDIAISIAFTKLNYIHENFAFKH